MKHLSLPFLVAFALPIAATAEVVYENEDKAWKSCLSWMKEAGYFYVQEGEGYNMYTRKIPLRFCFIDKDQKEFVGQELVKINKDEKFSATIEFGKGNFLPETKKTFKFK